MTSKGNLGEDSNYFYERGCRGNLVYTEAHHKWEEQTWKQMSWAAGRIFSTMHIRD